MGEREKGRRKQAERGRESGGIKRRIPKNRRNFWRKPSKKKGTGTEISIYICFVPTPPQSDFVLINKIIINIIPIQTISPPIPAIDLRSWWSFEAPCLSPISHPFSAFRTLLSCAEFPNSPPFRSFSSTFRLFFIASMHTSPTNWYFSHTVYLAFDGYQKTVFPRRIRFFRWVFPWWFQPTSTIEWHHFQQACSTFISPWRGFRHRFRVVFVVNLRVISLHH